MTVVPGPFQTASDPGGPAAMLRLVSTMAALALFGLGTLWIWRRRRLAARRARREGGDIEHFKPR